MSTEPGKPSGSDAPDAVEYSDLDEATRIVARAAAVPAQTPTPMDELDDDTRFVRRSPQIDDSTRIVTRTAAVEPAETRGVPAPISVPRAQSPATAPASAPSSELEEETRVVVRATAALPAAELTGLSEETRVVVRPLPADTAPHEDRRAAPTEASPQAADSPGSDIDDSTRIVVRSVIAYSAAELPGEPETQQLDDSTRIVARSAERELPLSHHDDDTRFVVRTAAATVPAASSALDDATRVVERDAIDEPTRITNPATRLPVATRTGAAGLVEMPEAMSASIAGLAASESLTAGEREIYKPRASPPVSPVVRTVVTPPTREVVASQAAVSSRRRSVVALTVGIAASALVVGAIVVAAVFLIAAL